MCVCVYKQLTGRDLALILGPMTLYLHSSILARRIPWTEEPGGLQSVGVTRVGHDSVTKPP